MRKFLVVIFTIIVSLSCDCIKRDYERLMASRITFPETLQKVDRQDMLAFTVKNDNVHMIIYFDSTECSTCAISKLEARGYCYGLPIFAESKKSILFTYIEDGKYRMCLHNKSENKSIQFENIKLDTDQPMLSVAETTFCFNSDNSQFIVIPDTYFWDEDGTRLGKEILPKCNNTGNPILAIVKL